MRIMNKMKNNKIMKKKFQDAEKEAGEKLIFKFAWPY